MTAAARPIFGPATALLVGHSPLRGCSLLAPCGRPKSLAAPSALIYEMTPKSLVLFMGLVCSLTGCSTETKQASPRSSQSNPASLLAGNPPKPGAPIDFTRIALSLETQG